MVFLKFLSIAVMLLLIATAIKMGNTENQEDIEEGSNEKL